MATLATRISDLATRIATELKAHKVFINNNAADLAALTTTAKGNLVAAINEVRALAASSGVAINDAATASGTTWSSTKIASEVTTQVNALLGASTPAALNTLDELAAALGDDANFAATTATALGNRLRYDAAQTLTAPQKVQAKANIDAYGNLEIGNPDTDFVAVLNAGLV